MKGRPESSEGGKQLPGNVRTGRHQNSTRHEATLEDTDEETDSEEGRSFGYECPENRWRLLDVAQ